MFFPAIHDENTNQETIQRQNSVIKDIINYRKEGIIVARICDEIGEEIRMTER